jgi:hypothetical protein
MSDHNSDSEVEEIKISDVRETLQKRQAMYLILIQDRKRNQKERKEKIQKNKKFT